MTYLIHFDRSTFVISEDTKSDKLSTSVRSAIVTTVPSCNVHYLLSHIFSHVRDLPSALVTILFWGGAEGISMQERPVLMHTTEAEEADRMDNVIGPGRLLILHFFLCSLSLETFITQPLQ